MTVAERLRKLADEIESRDSLSCELGPCTGDDIGDKTVSFYDDSMDLCTLTHNTGEGVYLTTVDGLWAERPLVEKLVAVLQRWLDTGSFVA